MISINENLLYGLIWVLYGTFAAYQTTNRRGDRYVRMNMFAGEIMIAIGMIVVSPIIAAYRFIYGTIKIYKI